MCSSKPTAVIGNASSSEEGGYADYSEFDEDTTTIASPSSSSYASLSKTSASELITNLPIFLMSINDDHDSYSDDGDDDDGSSISSFTLSPSSSSSSCTCSSSSSLGQSLPSLLSMDRWACVTSESSHTSSSTCNNPPSLTSSSASASESSSSSRSRTERSGSCMVPKPTLSEGKNDQVMTMPSRKGSFQNLVELGKISDQGDEALVGPTNPTSTKSDEDSSSCHQPGVSFAQSITVKEVPYWTDMEHVEARDVWISTAEFVVMGYSAMKDLQEIKKKGRASVMEMRGLESLLPGAAKRKQLRHKIHQDLVLSSQSYNHRLGEITNSEAIARMSEWQSFESVREAFERASVDQASIL